MSTPKIVDPELVRQETIAGIAETITALLADQWPSIRDIWRGAEDGVNIAIRVRLCGSEARPACECRLGFAQRHKAGASWIADDPHQPRLPGIGGGRRGEVRAARGDGEDGE